MKNSSIGRSGHTSSWLRLHQRPASVCVPTPTQLVKTTNSRVIITISIGRLQQLHHINFNDTLTSCVWYIRALDRETGGLDGCEDPQMKASSVPDSVMAERRVDWMHVPTIMRSQ